MNTTQLPHSAINISSASKQCRRSNNSVVKYLQSPIYLSKSYLHQMTPKYVPPLSSRSGLTMQLKVLRQIITSGFIDQVAVRQDIYLKKTTTFASTRNVPYRALGVPGEVYIHPSSALFHRSPPDFLVFSEIVQTSKAWMKGITKINGAWLPTLGKGLCSFSRPVDVPGKVSAKSLELQGGKQGDVREVLVVPHFGALGVDLPPVKKKQRREGARWVLVE